MATGAQQRHDGRQTTDRLAGILARSELLDGVDAAAFACVADDIGALELAPGDVLVAKGDEATHLYAVASGQLEVVLDTDNGVQRLSKLGEGAVVGEIGLLTGDVRSATVRAVTKCEVVSLSADGLRRLLAEHPHHGDALAARAGDRLRQTQLVEHFMHLFGVIDSDVLATIARLMEWVTVPAGRLLFTEGDVGDAAYLVASGRLGVFRSDPLSRAEVEIGQVARGDIVGELALLDGEPRSASVYAIRDSKLIRFSRAAYDELLDRHPRIGLAVARTALGRQRGRGDEPTGRRSFVLVAASPGVDLEEVAGWLVDALPDARAVTSADLDTELGRAGGSQIGDDDVGALRLGYVLEELEERHRHLVYVTDDTWTPWSRRALRWSDQVVLVADATADPAPSAHELELWGLVAKQHHPAVSLTLLHPPSTEMPSGTTAWLAPRSVASHHHVRRGDSRHLERLARLLAGTATSLVLGGGGAKGFAHLGVLEVLEELDVPIDMVGGTSIGSIMAVPPGLGWGAEKTRDETIAVFRDLLDYTVPATSMVRGARISSKLRSALGDLDIADLWIPYFCVSVDITTATAVYHDRGDLVTAIRASIAIPGVLPPVPIDGSLHVDGGVLDNVPVDEMRRRNPTGTVLAVDASPVQGPQALDDYGLSVSGIASIRARRRGAGPPSLGTTMVRSLLVGSVATRNRVVRDGIADLYLEVAVEGGSLLDFDAGRRIAEAAAESTRGPLSAWAAERARSTGEGEIRVSQFVRSEPARRSLVEPGQRGRLGGVLLLTVRDLRFRASRFGSVIVGIAVVLALLFLMTGLTEQFHREPRDTVRGFGADAWLVRDGASGAFTSAATMPVDTAAAVEGAGAAPVVVARHALTDGGSHRDVVVVGFAEGGLGAPELRDGRLPSAPDEVVIDTAAGLDVGEQATLGSATYDVVGRTTRRTMFAGMPVVFMDIEAAQDLLYRGQDLATAVLVAGTPTSVPDGFSLLTPDEVAEDATRPLERSISSVNLIRVLLWLVAALIIGTMTYLSALERRRDVAVLKAIGASTRQLGLSIALQGVLVAVVAAAMASVLQVVMVPVFPLEVSVPGRAFLQVPLIAVAVSLLAGAFGLRKAVGVDPALAFQGPGA